MTEWGGILGSRENCGLGNGELPQQSLLSDSPPD